MAFVAGLAGDKAAEKEEEEELLHELENLTDQEAESGKLQQPQMDELELHMAKLSVKEGARERGEERDRRLLEELPPVPTGAIVPPQRMGKTKPVLAT